MPSCRRGSSSSLHSRRRANESPNFKAPSYALCRDMQRSVGSPVKFASTSNDAGLASNLRYPAQQSTWLSALLLLGFTLLVGFLISTGLVARHLVVMFVFMVAGAYVMGEAARSAEDSWLPGLTALAMAVKLGGASARYFVLIVLYDGSGDAGRYNGFARIIAETWRNLDVPDLATVAFGSEGTRFTAWIAGLLYAPYQPSFQGGFWIFAFLAFLGQFLLYLAFRKSFSSPRWKRYAILIFFWPTLVYWPSSIGKEALIMLFLGVGCWAAANLYRDYRLRWLPLIAVAAYLTSMIRVHVAALFVGSLFIALLLARGWKKSEGSFRRALILLVGVVALVPLAIGVGQEFGVDLTTLATDDVDPVFADVADTTRQGGSSVSGGVIRSPLDVPAGVLKVLFRPLPPEADNLPMLASSIEGTLLLGLLLWQAPSLIRNRRQIRSSPYLLFCIVYSTLFIWAWSAILNLGILARQRSLVIPLLLAVVAALGWDDSETVPSGADEKSGRVAISSDNSLLSTNHGPR